MKTTKIYIMDEPYRGRYFEFEKENIYIGRSAENDIQLDDRFVSHRHVKVTRRGKKYLIKDLKSENGTFVSGLPVGPDKEFEVEEGSSIAIGLSLICLGEAHPEDVKAFHDLTRLSKDIRDKIKSSVTDRRSTIIKSQELIERASSTLMRSEDAKEISEKTARFVSRFLKRIDRVLVLLIEQESGKFFHKASRAKRTNRYRERDYCWAAIHRVLRGREPIMVADSFGSGKSELCDTMRLLNIGSLMCVPLVSGSIVAGIIYVDSLNRSYSFRQEDFSFLGALSRQATLALERAANQERMRA